MSYYYRSIEITDIKVTARALFNALIRSWTEDGIMEEMKHYLVAFASDGGKLEPTCKVHG